MKHALETLSKFDKYKIAILGDMLELGKISKTEHEDIGRFVSNLKLDQVYYVGPKMENAYLSDKDSLWFNNKSDLESELNKIDTEINSIANEKQQKINELVKEEQLNLEVESTDRKIKYTLQSISVLDSFIEKLQKQKLSLIHI